MNAFYGVAIATTLIHGLLFDFKFWKLYLCNLAIYTIWAFVTRSGKDNPRRKTLMISTWSGKLISIIVEPSNPSSACIEDINVTKTLEFVKEVNSSQD